MIKQKKIINGKKIAEKIKDEIVKEIIELDKTSSPGNKKLGLAENRPNLAIILVGEREDSKLYVDMKEKEAKKVGIDTHLYKCPSDIPEQEIFRIIDCLNKDDLIDAILVQLPLPKGFDTDSIIAAIDPAKDVDRFHPENLKTLKPLRGQRGLLEANLLPPVFGTVLEMLKSVNCEPASKSVCIIANSNIFSKNLAAVLKRKKAKVAIAHADDKNLKMKTSQADILITAVGKPGLIKKDGIKKDGIIIDIGITKKGKKIFGDVDFKDVEKKVSYITPVPGGVGPMTIAMLFKNTLELYKKRHKKSGKGT